jgi:hypothetical protein
MITLFQLLHFICFARTTTRTGSHNVVLNAITEGDNVIFKFNDTVRDNVHFVVLNNRTLANNYTIKQGVCRAKFLISHNPNIGQEINVNGLKHVANFV